jgi:high-affinity iron transporter
MLPAFVIGLREGVEAALIIGIIAVFLRSSGAAGALRSMWIGVAAAVALCALVGIGLEIAGRELPERAQEGLETVVSLVAVGMVTYMAVWMRRNAAGLKRALQAGASNALAAGSAGALVGMAFLAVLREGFETAVFLVAAFNNSGSPASTGTGAVLGIAVAIVLGWAVAAGGVRINLSRFFRVTGVVLILVAAGLLASAAHTAHEAGWLDIGQQRVLDLSAVVDPSEWWGALITGMLGIRPEPTRIEVLAWLAYLLPMTAYILRPARPPQRPAVRAPSHPALTS